MKQGELSFIGRTVGGAVRSVGGGCVHRNLFEDSIALKNLLAAWREFVKGKRKRADVLAFAADVEEALFRLHDELKQGTYRHGGYETFLVRDPKLRRIHKASVRDRLLHHAIHRVLYPHFDTRFIFDSYSSRKGKGAHAALKRFRDFAWRLSQNRTRVVWVLKADIRRFFDSVRHSELRALLEKNLPRDRKLHALLGEVIQSFNTLSGTGIPLGNLTSQLFSNVYLHPLDQFVKRELGVQHYIRYADDMIFLSADKDALEKTFSRVRDFLRDTLALELHPAKTELRKWQSGVDVLGFISYPSKTIMRPKTRKRMLRRLAGAGDFEAQENALYSRMKFER